LISSHHTPDQDIKRAYDWFLSFIGRETWEGRKGIIEAHMRDVLLPGTSHIKLGPSRVLAYDQDRFGFYLYLIEAFLFAPLGYEYTQGSRVTPIFKRIGMDLDRVTSIDGHEERVGELVNNRAEHPDAILFEIMTALAYLRNGWGYAGFVPTSSDSKTPDLRVEGALGEWFVECKRMSKSSDYSLRERESWLRMWECLSPELAKEGASLVIEVRFHAELCHLPDTFLKDALLGRLTPCLCYKKVFSSESCDVFVRPMDMAPIRKHLSMNYVKCPSPMLDHLLGGRKRSSESATSILKGSTVMLGDGPALNQYLEALDFAVYVSWSCDAPGAIKAKSRDIRRHLAEAVDQLPMGPPCCIHIGLETIDGGLVELERYRRICETVQKFDTAGKDLRWIYCHLFEADCRPEESWAIDETVYYFPKSNSHHAEPLSDRLLISTEHGREGGIHWRDR
jgi:hypothetical protein